MDETGRTLIRAAELIAKHGHIKGRLYSSDGRMCMYGAMVQANIDLMSDQERPMLEIFGSITAMVAWNNKRERTDQEVIDTLIAAAYWEQP